MSLNLPNVGGDPEFHCDNCDTDYKLNQLTENDGVYSCPNCDDEIYSTQA